MDRIRNQEPKSLADGRTAVGETREPHQTTRTQRVLRSREVTQRVGLSRTTIWRLRQQGDFPAPRRLSTNAVGWLEEEIDHWIASRAPKARLL